MKAPATCGEGLAERAALPAHVAQLLDALAENLELHIPALDMTDECAKREHDTYSALVREYRDIARRLEAAASRMASSRELPMGRHDPDAMRDPRIGDAWSRFVDVERALGGQLAHLADRDERLLDAVQNARSRP